MLNKTQLAKMWFYGIVFFILYVLVQSIGYKTTPYEINANGNLVDKVIKKPSP